MLKFESTANENMFQHKVMVDGKVIDTFKNYNKECTTDVYTKEVGVSPRKEVLKALGDLGLFEKYTTSSKSEDGTYTCKVKFNNVKNNSSTIVITSKKWLPNEATISVKESGFDDTLYVSAWIPCFAKSIKEGFIINDSELSGNGLKIGLPSEYISKYVQDTKELTQLVAKLIGA